MRILMIAVATIALGSPYAGAKSMIEQDCNLLGGNSHSSKVVTKTDGMPSATQMKKTKTGPKSKGQSSAHDVTSGACI